MKAQRDPRLKKEKDNARQRKIMRNSSDKASRKNAPKIKAKANRHIRRADKLKLRYEADSIEEDANALVHQHRIKDQHWGTYNAAESRARMQQERSFLNSTPNHPVKGRSRSRFMNQTDWEKE